MVKARLAPGSPSEFFSWATTQTSGRAGSRPKKQTLRAALTKSLEPLISSQGRPLKPIGAFLVWQISTTAALVACSSLFRLSIMKRTSSVRFMSSFLPT